MTTRQRLDVVMVECDLAESRNIAQRLIRAGEVRVDGQLVDKPSTRIPFDARVTVIEKPPFVSRGGEKLDAALERFHIHVAGAVVADVGASTGGFTDCLLQHGARRVYAIDVGYGQLHWDLRQDPRVEVMERTNARHLLGLPERVHLVTVDVSFISLALVLPTVVGWIGPHGGVLALIKPQFEAGRRDVEKGGVVRDARVHRRVLEDVLGAAAALDLGLRGLMQSPLRGPAGNTEFLAWWQRGSEARDSDAAISACLAEIA